MLPDLDVILTQDSGATFFTADLHVHSYGFSHDVTDKTMTFASLIDAALARNVGMISITDHNNDGQVLPSLEYSSKFSDRLLVIPGVEISTANGHVLVYCDPQTPELIATLLAKIDLQGPKGGRDTHTAWSMATVISQANQLGAIAIAAHIDRDKTGFEKLAAGYPNWKKDIIFAEGLYGLEFDTAANLKWYSPEDDGSDAAGQRQAIFGERVMKSELQLTRLAAVQNSDAHTLAEFNTVRPLTRYKMTELSFRSFKTAVIDSEARVRAIATVPPSIPKIVGMKMAGGFVDGEVYRFSPNLNCFIGGRGTGKSTAVQALAYAVGAHNRFDQYDNCPDTTIVFCEDANGILYRYERQRGGTWEVFAQDKNGNAIEAPAGIFKVEFYKQGHLAEVAKDPLKDPQLLQDFLDQHLDLSNAIADEAALIQELEHNSAELKPLQAGALQLVVKRGQLKEIDAKLKIAEQGKLKEIAAAQSQIGSEKAFLGALQMVAKTYEAGVSLSIVKNDYRELRKNAGDFTADPTITAAFQVCEEILAETNEWLRLEELRISGRLKEASAKLKEAIKLVPGRHVKWEERMAVKIDELRKQGLSGNLTQLSQLVAQRSQLTAEINKLAAQQAQLIAARRRREQLLAELSDVRATLSSRRRSQVSAINQTFKTTLRDYSVYLRYVSGGINTDFVGLVAEVMEGSFMQDKDIEKLCASTSPLALAELVRSGNIAAIATLNGVGPKWAPEIVKRFQVLEYLHRLEVTAQPPAPAFKVLTKTTPQKEISFTQLSDGQKHTILLTIALLAESNDPLIIDQPEDDLDNAFIFSSVVSTLRYIKERRQVIIVTHNANIAVLGDSELLLPMVRSGNVGKTSERGAIDRKKTKLTAQDVLEGGAAAFLKRKAIYGVD